MVLEDQAAEVNGDADGGAEVVAADNECPEREWEAGLTRTPRRLRWYVQATRTSLPRCVRTGGAGRLAPRAPRTVRTGYTYQPQALGTYRVPWQPRREFGCDDGRPSSSAILPDELQTLLSRKKRGSKRGRLLSALRRLTQFSERPTAEAAR